MAQPRTIVWFQLYVGTKEIGDAYKIKQALDDVYDLKEAVRQQCPDDLRHVVGAHKLNVFAAGADPSKDECLDPGEPVPTATTSKKPLIVVAPEKELDPRDEPRAPPTKRLKDKLSTGRPHLPPTPSTQLSQQNEAALAQALQSLSILFERKAACRMWTGDPTVYNLKATSFRDFDEAVRAKYTNIDNEESICYYFIKQKRDVGSRAYISNDDELDDFFDLARKPTIYIWPRGSPSLSPSSLPSQIEIHVSSAQFSSVTSGSSRGYAQKLFREAVRKRDDNTCVLSGEVLRPKAGNVEAAHIFGIESSLASQRDAAGVLNAYDTWNGMLLKKSLHVAFDAYLWCMDEFLVVHVSEEGKNKGLQKWEGTHVRLSVNSPTFPSRDLLKARFALYNERLESATRSSGPVTT